MGRKALDASIYIGQRFGMLEVTGVDSDRYDKRGHLLHFLKCHCDCGNDTSIELNRLLYGKTTSCGCMRKFNIDKYRGKKYGMLTIIGYDHDDYGSNNHVRRFVKCRCDCGNEIVTSINGLLTGDRVSCGCANRFDPNRYIGNRYGMLTVIDFDHDEINSNNVIHFMRCHCDCGNESIANLSHLINGHTTSCGCKKVRNVENFIGKRYGRLVVLGEDHEEYNQKRVVRYVKCHCDCGNDTIVNLQLLIDGTTKSCGCYNREIHTKHGKSNHRLYNILTGMKQRCYNPKKDNYALYGGRGIRICDEWLDHDNGFQRFYDWAMEHGYADDLTIDRIDSDGNYEPNNCRWVNALKQGKNIRANVFITYIYRLDKKRVGYLTYCATDWGRITGTSYQTIRYNLEHRNGRTINQILEHCNEVGNGYGKISVPQDLLQYNDPSKYDQSLHD